MHANATINVPLSFDDRSALSFLRGLFGSHLDSKDASHVLESLSACLGVHLVAVRSRETGKNYFAVKVGDRVHKIESGSDTLDFLSDPDGYPPTSIVLHLGGPIANLLNDSPYVFVGL